ncbi:MAG TPA: hypothetical protein VFA66_06090 [Gaiellaceae bacterium]|nr:hypothetical protein [Gaiellaceae bacterium]
MSARNVSSTIEIGPQPGVHARDRFGDRNRLETREHMLDERAPSIPTRARRTMHPVQQLADRDHADRSFLRADKCLECRAGLVALPLDQEVGVDQDGQELSGGAVDLRIARTSSTKSASTGGADASSSRNRSGDSNRAFGGMITATGAPARVTSISSPPATRFRTSEKRRATSVALRRTNAAKHIR